MLLLFRNPNWFSFSCGSTIYLILFSSILATLCSNNKGLKLPVAIMLWPTTGDLRDMIAPAMTISCGRFQLFHDQTVSSLALPNKVILDLPLLLLPLTDPSIICFSILFFLMACPKYCHFMPSIMSLNCLLTGLMLYYGSSFIYCCVLCCGLHMSHVSLSFPLLSLSRIVSSQSILLDRRPMSVLISLFLVCLPVFLLLFSAEYHSTQCVSHYVAHIRHIFI